MITTYIAFAVTFVLGAALVYGGTWYGRRADEPYDPVAFLGIYFGAIFMMLAVLVTFSITVAVYA